MASEIRRRLCLQASTSALAEFARAGGAGPGAATSSGRRRGSSVSAARRRQTSLILRDISLGQTAAAGKEQYAGCSRLLKQRKAPRGQATAGGPAGVVGRVPPTRRATGRGQPCPRQLLGPIRLKGAKIFRLDRGAPGS